MDSKTPNKALFITFHDPLCVNYGAGIRTNHLLKALSEAVDTDVLFISENTETKITKEKLPDNLGKGRIIKIKIDTKSVFDKLTTATPSKRITSAVKSAIDINEYSIIVIRYILPYTKLKFPAHIPILIDFDDPKYKLTLSSNTSIKSAIKEIIKFTNQLLVKTILQKDRTKIMRFLFTCQRDRSKFPHLSGEILPNLPTQPSQEYLNSPPKMEQSRTILFVGLMTWAPNSEAIQNFLDHIWPDILKAVPDAELRIVGKCDRSQIDQWSKYPNCTTTGYVDDIEYEYSNATLCIAPLQSGGGSNIKLAEAYAFRRPVVCTTYAHMGWKGVFDEDIDILVSDDNLGFSKHCITLLTDPMARDKIAKNGYGKYKKHLTLESFNSIVRSEIKNLQNTKNIQNS